MVGRLRLYAKWLSKQQPVSATVLTRISGRTYVSSDSLDRPYRFSSSARYCCQTAA